MQALGRQRQVDLEFKASLVYRVRVPGQPETFPKKANKKKKMLFKGRYLRCLSG